jgi:hypothetical protein
LPQPHSLSLHLLDSASSLSLSFFTKTAIALDARSTLQPTQPPAEPTSYQQTTLPLSFLLF